MSGITLYIQNLVGFGMKLEILVYSGTYGAESVIEPSQSLCEPLCLFLIARASSR